MGSVMTRAIAAAGLGACHEELLAGAGLAPANLARLRDADLLLVAALADSARAAFRGDEVQISSALRPNDANLIVFEPGAAHAAMTGADLLREIALLRLATPADRGIAVSFDTLGLELAQTALLFGADTLFGDLGGKRTLPLLDGREARQRELKGLVERSGRKPRFAAEPARIEEQHP